MREYLLEKWGRTCAYCGARDVALEMEHVVPKSRGGSDRVGNLTLSCRPCNLAKGNRTAEEFGHSEVQRLAGRAFPHAAAMNATRSAILQTLVATGLSVETGTGGMTKYNRSRLHMPKSHANDALCVGTSTPARLSGARGFSALVIRAVGRGQYRRTDTDASGFPRAYRTRRKSVSGFRSGDLVRSRTRRGRHEGTAVVRSSGYFDLKSGGRRVVQGVSSKRCELLQRFDGYAYELGQVSAPQTSR
ncbi:HNH endonuclease [Rubrobacter tropicus]|uniref:HNH endonuclease n=1 Tax=Rubrobacter tropicus TaxID=2653851 RepID=UPI001A9DD9BC|nr:HNH endonuclease [Rubrobacter tropicus]